MARRFVLPVIVCALVAFATPVLRGTQAPQGPDPRISALIAQAQAAGNAAKFEEAHAKADESLALAQKIGDRLGIAMSYRSKGGLYGQQGMSRDAVPWNERALREFEAIRNQLGIASSLLGLAVNADALGESAKVREYATRALPVLDALGDRRGRVRCLILLLRSEPDKSADDPRYAEILRIAAETGDAALAADAAVSLGTIHLNAGRFDAAKAAYENAIAVLEKGDRRKLLGATYLSLGRVYRAHGDFEGAILRYEKAIALLQAEGDLYAVTEAFNAKAIALDNLGRLDEGLATYQQALVIARQSGNPRLIDFIEGNLAAAYTNAGRYDVAVATLEAALAKRPEPNLAGHRHHALAIALRLAGRPAEALAHADEAIGIAREPLRPVDLIARLDNRATILSNVGRHQPALDDLREEIDLIESLRATLVPSDFLKRGWSTRIQSAYSQVVAVLAQLGRHAEAIESAELGRSRAFLDLMAARESDDPLVTRGASETAAAADIVSGSFGAPVSLARMQQIASRLHTTVVSYWVNEESSFAWVLAPGREPAMVRIDAGRAKLAALVAATTEPLRPVSTTAARPSTTTRGADEDIADLPMRGLGLALLRNDTKSSWIALTSLLIEPIRAQLPARGGRVTIVPHGPLFHLSFAGLRSAAGRYLLEDYELHYVPAVSVLDFTERRQATLDPKSADGWAIVGNPSILPSVGGKPLAPLPGAGREIASIAGLAPAGRVRQLAGAAADEDRLTRLLESSRPSVLHFATHGFVSDDTGVPPFLALNRRGESPGTDGRLTLDEVYGLRLSTDMVVLSACRTGSGQISADGIVGLTRGFFYAGSPTVVATFWDVTDETSARLMSSFYRSYARAAGKSRSLRSAQLALLADLRAGKVVVTVGGRKVTLPEHPLLWAAFFLSGEP